MPYGIQQMQQQIVKQETMEFSAFIYSIKLGDYIDSTNFNFCIRKNLRFPRDGNLEQEVAIAGLNLAAASRSLSNRRVMFIVLLSPARLISRLLTVVISKLR